MSSIPVYLGLLAALAGLTALIRPWSCCGLRSRRAALLVAVPGLAVAGAALLWPASLQRSAGGSGQLDRFMPLYHFHEIHETRMHAPPHRIVDALKEVTLDDIRMGPTLFWLRGLPGRLLGEAPASRGTVRPVLSVTDSPHALILADSQKEILIGIVGRFWAAAGGPRPRIADARAFQDFDKSGYAKAAMSFSLEDQGEGWYRVTTETRVLATDSAAAGRFAAYWRVIYPGSSLIRVTFLQAVKRKAEGNRKKEV